MKTELLLNTGGSSDQIYLTKAAHRRKGYYICRIAGKNFYVHHIVAEAYVPNKRPLVYKMVLHKNADSLDNHYSNLTWGNATELYRIRFKLGIPGAGVTPVDKKTVLKLARKHPAGEVTRITGIKYHTVCRWLKAQK